MSAIAAKPAADAGAFKPVASIIALILAALLVLAAYLLGDAKLLPGGALFAVQTLGLIILGAALIAFGVHFVPVGGAPAAMGQAPGIATGVAMLATGAGLAGLFGGAWAANYGLAVSLVGGAIGGGFNDGNHLSYVNMSYVFGMGIPPASGKVETDPLTGYSQPEYKSQGTEGHGLPFISLRGIPHNTVMLIGAVISIVSLYIAIIGAHVLHTDCFAVFGGFGVIGALIWGNSTIKKLCSYGIGTGVPSAGMLAFGAGTAAFIAGSAFFTTTYFCIWSVPIMIIVFALILGLIFGWIANSVENMKIPVMTRSIAELTIVGALSLAGVNLQGSFLGAGIIAVGFMLGALALQHPFNACLGPGEKQDRTNMLALECGFLSMIVMAIISFVFVSAVAGWISLIVAVLGWIINLCSVCKIIKA
ncbi:unnamed protein product [Cylicocyclus nassatus]|uniref:Tetrahydromethanopterin S-methyltransferase n=1 Tax=Cylicocyclus nassatus TaxID=53992 RepID=A0AA36GYF8_CYLNA|nr:unnamed protein product [Cylicocyclus nassatus]